jgi:hypothetical protein
MEELCADSDKRSKGKSSRPKTLFIKRHDVDQRLEMQIVSNRPVSVLPVITVATVLRWTKI